MEDYKKKYEESLERGLRLWESGSITLEEYEYMFPEHKESKDERIRKFLYDFINNIPPEEWNKDKPNEDFRITVLDWLEKQGEQKPTDKVEPKFKVGDIVINKKSKDTVKIVQILHDSYCYSGWDGAATVHSDFSISEQDNWELVEHKHNWSEEDERKITGISIVLQSWDSYHVSSAGLPSFIPEYISWLKSLKERIGE